MLADSSLTQMSSVTEEDGTKRYFSCGVLHREDGPAEIEVYSDYDGPEKHRSWYRFGVLHRDDGPAVIGGRITNGQYEWFRAGLRHRDDGPAVIEVVESSEYGRGPVYEWWRNGILSKIQDGDGIIYHFENGENVVTELPDGRCIIDRDGDLRYENAEGADLGYTPGLLEAYEGYLEQHKCSYPLYSEPQETFDKYNPIDGRPE
jgi:hypothetical protein